MVSTFLQYIKLGSKSQLIYTKRLYFQVVQAFFSLIAFAFVWISLDKIGLVQDLTLSQLILFTIISNAITLVIPRNNVSFSYEQDIRMGNIVTKLLKPFPVDFMYFGDTIGSLFTLFITNVIPFVVVALLFRVSLVSITVSSFMVFMVAMILGIIVYFLIDNLAGYLCFWVHLGTSVRHLFEAMMMTFSGRIIPIVLMPLWFGEISKYTPARLVYNDPISIITGIMPKEEYGEYFVRVFIWVVVLLALREILRFASQRKIYAQGG